MDKSIYILDDALCVLHLYFVFEKERNAFLIKFIDNSVKMILNKMFWRTPVMFFLEKKGLFVV